MDGDWDRKQAFLYHNVVASDYAVQMKSQVQQRSHNLLSVHSRKVRHVSKADYTLQLNQLGPLHWDFHSTLFHRFDITANHFCGHFQRV